MKMRKLAKSHKPAQGAVASSAVLPVNVKCDDEDETCMVHQAECPSQGDCKSVMECERTSVECLFEGHSCEVW